MHGGDVWKYAKQLRRNTNDMLDFSANINPLGPPSGVQEVLKQAVNEIAYYPEPHARTLRAELADCYGVDPQEVIVGNGAAELIFLYCRAREGLQAVVPAPTFSEYALACRAAGGDVHAFPLGEKESFRLCPEEFLERYSQWKQTTIKGSGLKGDPAVFLCHPNNPTGLQLSRPELKELVEGLGAAGAAVFLDLSFLGFVPGQCLENGTLPAVPVDHFSEIIRANKGVTGNNPLPAGLFLLFSFTKLFALPGIRLGFGIGPRQLIVAMEQKRDPWTVNSMAQHAGAQCLQEKEYVKKSIALITAARREMVDGLAEIGGIKVFPGVANFLLCQLRERQVKAANLVAALAKEGILVRSAADFPGLDPYYIRLAVRRPDENAVLLEKLAFFLKQ